jgi:hypothetical protein
MKSRSAKNKGKRLQNEVRDAIRTKFPELEPDDVLCTMMSESGTDIKLSPAARKKFPYSIECKNVEKLNMWSALQQSEDNCKEGTTAAVVFRRNRSKAYIALDFEEFLKLIQSSNSSVEVIEKS